MPSPADAHNNVGELRRPFQAARQVQASTRVSAKEDDVDDDITTLPLHNTRTRMCPKCVRMTAHKPGANVRKNQSNE